MPRKNDRGGFQPQRPIQPGDSGIWVTCNKGREGRCTGEILDLLNEYAERLYPETTDVEDSDDEDVDIEKAIQAEVDNIKRPGRARLFTPVKIDVQCVVFIKTIAPVEPVSLVKTICEEAMADSTRKRTRNVKRLSPITLMGRASTETLEKVATEVLAPHFHQQDPFQKRKVRNDA